jgi:SAM-dependent methyltransferase
MTNPVELEDTWLSIGAIDKATSVEHLARGLRIESVLEVGCGTGALLAEIIRRRIGTEYAACEPSPELYAHAHARSDLADVDIRCGTFAGSAFDKRRWDLIVVSHVLEHMHDPSALVVQVLAAARYVIIEVPIEGTRMGGFRSLLRRAITGRRRTDNAAGHIQFFSGPDVRRLVHWAGGRVTATRPYFPAATYRHMASGAGGLKRTYYSAWIVADRVLGSRLITHLYYGHLAVLAGQRSLDYDQDDPHPLFWHPSAP